MFFVFTDGGRCWEAISFKNIDNTMAHSHLLVFCRKIGDTGTFIYKIKSFNGVWIATAYDAQDVTIF